MKIYISIVLIVAAQAAQTASPKPRPRVFVEASESVEIQSNWLLGSASQRRVSPLQSVLEQFSKNCPDLEVTDKQEGADYHAKFSGDWGQAVSLFDKGGTLIYSGEAKTRWTHSVSEDSVKNTCNAIRKREGLPIPAPVEKKKKKK